MWNVLDSHQTRSYEQAIAVLEDMLGMEFNQQMNEHFKWPANW